MTEMKFHFKIHTLILSHKFSKDKDQSVCWISFHLRYDSEAFLQNFNRKPYFTCSTNNTVSVLFGDQSTYGIPNFICQCNVFLYGFRFLKRLFSYNVSQMLLIHISLTQKLQKEINASLYVCGFIVLEN